MLTHENINQIISDVFDVPNEDESNVENLTMSFIKLGDTYLKLHKFKDALESYKEAYKIDPNCDMAFNRVVLTCPQILDYEPNKLSDEDKIYNDTVRQTFVGVEIVYSKKLLELNKESLDDVKLKLQTLPSDYFKSLDKASANRDFGFFNIEENRYVWFINHCELEVESELIKFSVIFMMTKDEFGTLYLGLN